MFDVRQQYSDSGVADRVALYADFSGRRGVADPMVPDRALAGAADDGLHDCWSPRPEQRLTMMTWAVPGGMVLSLGGELDLVDGPRLIERVAALLAEGHTKIVLDLAHLRFCDCSGIRAMLSAKRLAEESAGWLRLSRVRRTTRQIIELTGLADVLVCHSSADAACSAQ